jgi:hypothetical protein
MSDLGWPRAGGRADYFLPAFNRAQRLRCAAAMRARPAVDRVLRLPAARCPKLVESIDSAFSAASMRARSCRRWRIIPCSAFMRRIVAATTVGRAEHICVRLRRSRESRNSGRNRGCGMQFPLTPRWSGYGTARCARRPGVRASTASSSDSAGRDSRKSDSGPPSDAVWLQPSRQTSSPACHRGPLRLHHGLSDRPCARAIWSRGSACPACCHSPGAVRSTDGSGSLPPLSLTCPCIPPTIPRLHDWPIQ